MKKLLLIALSTFAVSAHAWEPTFYLGGNVGSAQINPNRVYSNFSMQSLEGVAGVKLFKYVAVELRGAVPLGVDSEWAKTGINFNDPDDDEDDEWVVSYMQAGLEYYGSFYLKPFVANEKASLYGLLGYTSVGLDFEPGLADDDTDAGPSWGIGFTYKLSPKVDFVLEWKEIIAADNFNIAGGAAGFTYSF